MLTDNRADYRTQDWFLIACDGDLTLKLAQDLLIGEDERGQTVLSPAREDALLRVTSEHGCLTLQAMAMDWTFSEEGGLSLQHLTFVEGLTLKLSFPSSSLILTPDFQAGAGVPVDREIRLKPTPRPALTLTRLDEPVKLIEPALLPAPEAANADLLEMGDLQIEEAAEQAKAAAALTRWDHQIPDEIPDALDLTIPAPEPAEAASAGVPAELQTHAAADRSAATQSEPTPSDANHASATPASFEEPSPSSEASPAVEAEAEVRVVPTPETTPGSTPVKKTHKPLAGLIAAAALLTPMYLFLIDGQKLGVDFPLTNYRPLDELAQRTGTVERVSEPPAIATTQSADSPATIQPATAQPVPIQPTPIKEETLPPVTVEPSSDRVDRDEFVPTDRDALLIASLLAEAKAFYDAGLIVTPIEANTVSHLTQVLSMDPSNEEGLRLMYLSAVTLIEEAQAAHAAGDNFLARNLVEDVLGFHPEFDDARALLDSWTREPEG